MIAIVQKENPVLRLKAKAVPVSKITSTEIQNIIVKMKKALASQSDGVAIAAPQIGESLRIFVVSGKIFEDDFLEDRAERLAAKKGLAAKETKSKLSDLVFINPVFVKKSRIKKDLPEGCLSVRWTYGKVPRSTQATVTAYDENGKTFTRGAGGLLAQIFQHEIDHLDGILFIDKAHSLEDVPPPEMSKS